jgi:hypothetical protein
VRKVVGGLRCCKWWQTSRPRRFDGVREVTGKGNVRWLGGYRLGHKHMTHTVSIGVVVSV